MAILCPAEEGLFKTILKERLAESQGQDIAPQNTRSVQTKILTIRVIMCFHPYDGVSTTNICTCSGKIFTSKPTPMIPGLSLGGGGHMEYIWPMMIITV